MDREVNMMNDFAPEINEGKCNDWKTIADISMKKKTSCFISTISILPASTDLLGNCLLPKLDGWFNQHSRSRRGGAEWAARSIIDAERHSSVAAAYVSLEVHEALHKGFQDG
ncbi:hypothetical protein KIN20_019575 [Parelaphostrongylus tenuis]|uniref:Uncharacterized protein n=1 Tax=Parelaphostrongylus tenuis TaxID=148309 RepID=A0AAD5MPQ2_PARTN|nr:hypothetical protein KIN20_019575 [Parelaphostrongylus tenuis]